MAHCQSVFRWLGILLTKRLFNENSRFSFMHMKEMGNIRVRKVSDFVVRWFQFLNAVLCRIVGRTSMHWLFSVSRAAIPAAACVAL